MLLDALEENVTAGRAKGFLYFLEWARRYSIPSSIEGLFDSGRYSAPFWSDVPVDDARRALMMLKEFVKDNYRADLGNYVHTGKDWHHDRSRGLVDWWFSHASP